jgi:hypothetical protein
MGYFDFKEVKVTFWHVHYLLQFQLEENILELYEKENSDVNEFDF